MDLRYIFFKLKRTEFVIKIRNQCGLQLLETRRRVAWLKLLSFIYNRKLKIYPEQCIKEGITDQVDQITAQWFNFTTVENMISRIRFSIKQLKSGMGFLTASLTPITSAIFNFHFNISFPNEQKM